MILRLASALVSSMDRERKAGIEKRLHIPYLVTGSMAIIAHGETRFTWIRSDP